MPEPVNLKKVRQEIDYNWDEFRAIVGNKKFKSIFGDLYRGKDISLANVPKGYEKENPAGDYLKLKCFIAETHIGNETLSTASLHKKTVAAFIALQPLLQFINRAIIHDD